MINIVVPIYFDATYNGGMDLKRAVTGLFPSIEKYIDNDFICRVFIITPQRSIDALRVNLVNFSFYKKIKIFSDEEVIEGHNFDFQSYLDAPPWFRQQILKIAISKFIGAELALYCDSDVLVIKPINQDVFASGIPYEGMGYKNFNKWFYASMDTLYRNQDPYDSFRELIDMQPMGVTPEFLVPEVLRGLINHLSIENENWIQYLINKINGFDNSWNEYSLYWIYYCNNFKSTYKYFPSRLYIFINNLAEINNKTGQELFMVMQSATLQLNDHSNYF